MKKERKLTTVWRRKEKVLNSLRMIMLMIRLKLDKLKEKVQLNQNENNDHLHRAQNQVVIQDLVPEKATINLIEILILLYLLKDVVLRLKKSLPVFNLKKSS
jgi:hypothetical protein